MGMELFKHVVATNNILLYFAFLNKDHRSGAKRLPPTPDARIRAQEGRNFLAGSGGNQAREKLVLRLACKKAS